MKRMQTSIVSVGLACTVAAGLSTVAACSGEPLSSPLGTHNNGASGSGVAIVGGDSSNAGPGAASRPGSTAAPSACDGKSRQMTAGDQIQIAIPATHAVANGGDCVEKCFDHPSKTITLTGEWNQYITTFAELEQAGFGNPARDDA